MTMVATLPCQSGNRRQLVLQCLRFRVATLPCQSGNTSCINDRRSIMFKLQLYHAKAETCNFTMPQQLY